MNNPIIQREFIGLLRTRRAIVVQALLSLVMALVVVARWPADAIVDLSGQQAQDVLRLFTYGLLLAFLILAPIFPASSLVRERKSGTLALLLNSPMGPFSIVLGKLAGNLGFTLLLLVLSLPAATACYTMGGVSLADHLLPVYAVLVLLALFYASLGLLVSSFVASVDSALRVTYALVLVLSVGVLIPQQFIGGLEHMPAVALKAASWLQSISPIPAIMLLLGDTFLISRGLRGPESVFGMHVTASVTCTMICFVATILRINPKLVDRPRAAGKVTDDRSLFVRLYRRVMYMWFFDPQRRSGLISDFTNPVMVKEFRTRRFGRAHWLARIAGLCLIASLALMLATSNSTLDWGPATLSGVVISLQIALVILLTPGLASGLISTERESGGWTLLQTSRLSSWTIIVGKLVSVFVTLLLFLLATLPSYIMLWYIEASTMTPSVIPRVIVTLLLMAVFSVFFSAAVSSLFSRTAPATVTSYAVLSCLGVGTLVFYLGRDNPFRHGVVEAALGFSPLAAALSQLGFHHFGEYKLVPFNWWFLGIGSFVSVVVLVVQTAKLTRPQ